MFFILAVSNYEEYQYMVDILTLNATQYFSNGIVYENINECVANIGGKEEVHLDFSMLSKHELFGFVETLYKIAGKETKLSPNLSLLLSEYYSDILAFKMCHIGAYRTLCNEVHLAWKMWVQFGYANGKRIRDIEKLLCESADVGFLTSYCNSIKAVPDTVLSMVGGKRGIDSIQYKKLIELKDKL